MSSSSISDRKWSEEESVKDPFNQSLPTPETLGELNQDDFIEETFAYYVTALEELKEVTKELVELEEDLPNFMSEIDEEQSEEESVKDPFNQSLSTQETLEELITGDGVVRSRVVIQIV